MKTISSLILVFIGLGSSANTNIKYSTKEYVEEWKEVAISQMQSFGIPASITLAQAILESANGNSDLAIIANNHFGIKCNTWKGDTYYKNDDQANECFRKYNSAKESYDDHSQFLKNKTRYASLFNLEKTDYKAWAQGLKDAGYATNPNYPKLLIDLIERLNLYELDGSDNEPEIASITENPQKTHKVIMMANTHDVLNHKNKIKYIVAKKRGYLLSYFERIWSRTLGIV